MDFEKLRDKVVAILKESFGKVLEGAQEDLDLYAREIATDLIAAAREGREDLVDELVHQTRTLAERNRLRAVHEAWDTAEEVARVAGKTLLVVVGGLV